MLCSVIIVVKKAMEVDVRKLPRPRVEAVLRIASALVARPGGEVPAKKVTVAGWPDFVVRRLRGHDSLGTAQEPFSDYHVLHPSGSSQFAGASANMGLICSSEYPARPHPMRVTSKTMFELPLAKFKKSRT